MPERTYRELQEICRRNNLPAGGSREALLERLDALGLLEEAPKAKPVATPAARDPARPNWSTDGLWMGPIP